MTSSASADDADDYDDEPEEGDPVGAAALDIVANVLAGAVTGAGGIAVGGPAGALISNAATPILAAVFQKGLRPWWGDWSRRAEKMMESAADAGKLTREELADRAAESEESRFLTYKAVQAAADTIWPEGVRAIGRAYAAGLLSKDKPVLDIRLRALGIMEDLDEMHVRLLELLVRYQPEVRQEGVGAIPQRFPSYRDKLGWGTNPVSPKEWYAGERIWFSEQISHLMPDLEPVLDSLLGELRESGLIRENDTTPDALSRLSEDVASLIRGQAETLSPQKTTVEAPVPSWSATELGEKILMFYAEAGAEDDQTPGGYPGQATS